MRTAFVIAGAAVVAGKPYRSKAGEPGAARDNRGGVLATCAAGVLALLIWRPYFPAVGLWPLIDSFAAVTAGLAGDGRLALAGRPYTEAVGLAPRDAILVAVRTAPPGGKP